MAALIKQRYLDILAAGTFARLNPEELDVLHTEVGQYLKNYGDTLDAGDLFALYELQFYVLLLTNHDVEAKSYLDRFNDQFAGKKSQKIMVLRLMYYEATGDKKAAIDALGTDPNELRASRRLATFARAGKEGTQGAVEYIKSLNHYLDLQPADALAWAELGDVYSSVGHYERAVFCFKEVLLHAPDAHNMYYKAGLNLYLQHLYLCGLGLGLGPDKKDALLAALAVVEHARDCFLKSVEINQHHAESWLGVYLLAHSPLLAKVSAHKALAGLQKPEAVLASMARLEPLAKRQVMAIRGLADEAAFTEFLESPPK